MSARRKTAITTVGCNSVTNVNRARSVALSGLTFLSRLRRSCVPFSVALLRAQSLILQRKENCGGGKSDFTARCSVAPPALCVAILCRHCRARSSFAPSALMSESCFALSGLALLLRFRRSSLRSFCRPFNPQILAHSRNANASPRIQSECRMLCRIVDYHIDVTRKLRAVNVVTAEELLSLG